MATKKNIEAGGKRIVISRTDSIGDVMLTLPIVAWLKDHFPGCHISFLCKNYTAPIVRCFEGVDEILLLDEIEALPESEQVSFIASGSFDIVIHVFPRKNLASLFKKAKVRYRIGTSHRLFHLFTCNIRPGFTRKRSPLHESQLNFELLRPLGLTHLPTLEELNESTKRFRVKPAGLPGNNGNETGKYVILHPKSQGSAREWPMDKYADLALQLANEGTTVFFTGTENEGLLFRDSLPQHDRITDTTGKLSIDQLLTLISRADALVACSTGPLHISGFLGIKTIGLYSPKIPIHPGRWKPLGENVKILVYDQECPVCKSKQPCNCISDIPVEKVLQALNS